MVENSFQIIYNDILSPLGKRLLSGMSAKTHSLKFPFASIAVKTHTALFSQLNFMNIGERVIKAFAPMQGSDIIFISFFLSLLRPVIVTLASHMGEFSVWAEWGWDMYTAIVMSVGIFLYFLRRFMLLHKIETKT